MIQGKRSRGEVSRFKDGPVETSKPESKIHFLRDIWFLQAMLVRVGDLLTRLPISTTEPTNKPDST